jgi:integrase
MRKVTKPSESRGRVRFLSDEERKCLLNACKESPNPHLHIVVVLALSTGMRQAEIMNLKWADVDLQKGRIILHETKNGERRVVHIKGLALQLLEGLDRKRRIDTPMLFPGREPRKPIDLRFPWERALKASRIENFRFHDLRHSAASYLAMNGASLAEIAEVLGHKTLAMVKRYAHLSETHTAGVVASMNERIFG